MCFVKQLKYVVTVFKKKSQFLTTCYSKSHLSITSSPLALDLYKITFTISSFIKLPSLEFCFFFFFKSNVYVNFNIYLPT